MSTSSSRLDMTANSLPPPSPSSLHSSFPPSISLSSSPSALYVPALLFAINASTAHHRLFLTPSYLPFYPFWQKNSQFTHTFSNTTSICFSLFTPPPPLHPLMSLHPSGNTMYMRCEEEQTGVLQGSTLTFENALGCRNWKYGCRFSRLIFRVINYAVTRQCNNDNVT